MRQRNSYSTKLPDDRSILSRLRRSDRTVIDDLYVRYAPELRLWLGQVESWEDSEDLIADAFAIAWATRTTIRRNVKECLISCLRRAVEEDGRWQWRGKMWVEDNVTGGPESLSRRLYRDGLLEL